MSKKTKHLVLVHGLYMPSLIMQYLDRHFKKLGYATYRFRYNSLKSPQAARRLDAYVNSRFTSEDEVYFFGHSLGGLVIRNYFAAYNSRFKNTCIITAGTPHHGSEVAASLRGYGFGFLMGESQEILSHGLGEYLGDVPLFCIVGKKDVGVGRVVLGRRTGGGTVLESEARCDKAHGIELINLNHTALVYSKRVVELSDGFIKGCLPTE